MRTKIARVPLAGGVDTAGGIGGWTNPEPTPIYISRLEIDVQTVASAACTVDAGTTPTSLVTSSNNLITGLDVNAAAGVFDNITDKGASGKSRQKVPVGGFVTFSRASGASAGLVGMAYIHYHPA